MQLLKQSMHATVHCIVSLFLLIIDYAMFNNSKIMLKNLKYLLMQWSSVFQLTHAYITTVT